MEQFPKDWKLQHLGPFNMGALRGSELMQITGQGLVTQGSELTQVAQVKYVIGQLANTGIRLYR